MTGEGTISRGIDSFKAVILDGTSVVSFPGWTDTIKPMSRVSRTTFANIRYKNDLFQKIKYRN